MQPIDPAMVVEDYVFLQAEDTEESFQPESAVIDRTTLDEEMFKKDQSIKEIRERKWSLHAPESRRVYYKKIGQKMLYLNMTNHTYTEIKSEYPQELLACLTHQAVEELSDIEIEKNRFLYTTNEDFLKAMKSEKPPAEAAGRVFHRMAAVEQQPIDGPVRRGVSILRNTRDSLQRVRQYLFVSGCLLGLWAISSSVHSD